MVDLDQLVWISIFKQKEAYIVVILFIYLDSHDCFLNVNNKGLLVDPEVMNNGVE